MKIQYRKVKNGIEIVRCFGTEPYVVLPTQIEGLPIIRVAAYTFSSRKSEEDADVLEYQTEDTILSENMDHLLAGIEVEEVVFPDTVESIGNYIFYGCKSLNRIEFSDTLMDIGSGAFTGCDRLSKLDVHLNKGEKSCVKEILGDLWQRIDVTFYYDDKKEKVDLVFPEHYEEAVENTPARILFTQHHGSGNNYRQCFTSKEVDYRKYDELFAVAKVYDKTELLTDLVFSRLISGKGLTEKCKRTYEDYISDNMRGILQKLITNNNSETKIFSYMQEMLQKRLLDIESLDLAIELSTDEGMQELSAWLMNERFHFATEAEKNSSEKVLVGKKRKKFAL